MAFEEDFDQFLDQGDFGEPVTWNGQTFNAIFDNETYSVEGEGSVRVDIQQPKLMMKTSDSTGMKQGDTLSRDEVGVNYIIQTIAPDGTGMSELGLSATPGTLDARNEALQGRERRRYGQS